MAPTIQEAQTYAELARAVAIVIAVAAASAGACGCVWLLTRLFAQSREIAKLKDGNASLTAKLLEAQSAVVRAVQKTPPPIAVEPPRWSAATALGLGDPRRSHPPAHPTAPTLPSLEAMRGTSPGWEDHLDRTGAFELGRLRREQEELLPPSRRTVEPAEPTPPPLPSKPPPATEPPPPPEPAPASEEPDVHSRRTSVWKGPPSSRTPSR